MLAAMGLLDSSGNGRLSFGAGDDDERASALSAGRIASVGRISAPIFYALLGVVCLWVFAYVSGLFPYLGTGRVDNRSSPGMQTDIGSTGLGIKTMLLFKGQTAFIDYKSTSPESEITLDVKPVTVLGYSDAMQRVKGEAEGTAEFPIEATGLYKFRHEPALGRRYGRTSYSVSWGAR
jgi:hypothetical protein